MNVPDDAKHNDDGLQDGSAGGTGETPPRPATRARRPARGDGVNPAPPARSYWIGVVARDHVELAVAGGYAQLNHGKAGPLERMRAGDGFAFYSARTSGVGRSARVRDGAPPADDGAGEPLQAFTAIGRVRDGAVYRVEAGGGFQPFRMKVDYLDATPAPVRPLLDSLSFIRSRTHWGAAFRYGFLRVPEEDFARIAAAMGRDLAADFGA